jgi:hypothetical protein
MLRVSQKGDCPTRLIIDKALWSGVCVLFLLAGCSKSRESRIHVQLHDIPEANTQRTTALSCPPGDPPGNDASSHQGGGHSVRLSWNSSTSSNNSKGEQISYCLYRTSGGPVRASGNRTSTSSPCINCQRVTTNSITRTEYKDTNVENGAHYCYVAIAVQAGNIETSGFSNQADAVIPPKSELPFCNARAPTRGKRPAKHR